MTPQPEVDETTADAPDAKPKGLKYSRISTEEQKQLLELRLRALEGEHFQHSSNLDVQTTTGNDDAARQTRVALVEIEQAHALVSKQLADLK